MSAAHDLASRAAKLDPTDEDLALAGRSLLDTVAVAYAAREHPLRPLFDELSDAGRWAALAHVLDYDDLHLPSTTHISAICVAVALASGGDARAYLAGAGVMARLGTALGWRHYRAGWHATCTAGAPAAAVAAAVSRGLEPEQIAIAIVLALPAAGGVQRAFGTAAKALQVGFAADAGVRAAVLAQQGATADPLALEQWLELVGGDAGALAAQPAAPAVPGGLAIKLYPCCYALQRPIAAFDELPNLAPADVRAVRVATPASSLKPLIHSSPRTGLEGKFSLEYAVAAALLDGRPDQQSFTDEAVMRSDAQTLMELVEVTPVPGGVGLLDGELDLEIALRNGDTMTGRLRFPPGAPDRPPTDVELAEKIEACAGAEADEIMALTWHSAASFLRLL
jgi:2-methylcitrate dehydratase PrpD